MNDQSRHLSPETLATYFSADHVVVHKMASWPKCVLRIDPQRQKLALWTVAKGTMPDVAVLNRLSVTAETTGADRWFVLTVDAGGAHFEAYSLLAAIVDDLEVGLSFDGATQRSISTYRDLLAARTRLSEERVTGLIAELLLLEHLIKFYGDQEAMRSWVGPSAEEHDFVMQYIDVEVKCTLSEVRRHVIASEYQLMSSPGRDLWLVSIQLTKAGDAQSSIQLGELIGRVRRLLASTERTFEAMLDSHGWRECDAQLYPERYMYRAPSTSYRVDENFPALTRPRIEQSAPRAELIGPVTYRVDVSSMKPSHPPDALAGFVEGTRS